ncbi:hypothetical protein TNCV_89151 [Trichonephila clavipes]|nr:hypothetical protein TNCV_89151 [Trichonephila clavipes]
MFKPLVNEKMFPKSFHDFFESLHISLSSDRVMAYRAFTPQVRGSNPELGKVDSEFHPFNGSINEYQACLGLNTGGTSDHAPQRPRSRKLRWAQPWPVMGCCAIE